VIDSLTYQLDIFTVNKHLLHSWTFKFHKVTRQHIRIAMYFISRDLSFYCAVIRAKPGTEPGDHKLLALQV